jgi:broad specificity phosphatase PhoE
MLECYIVRHAITTENLNYTLIGRTDTPLHPLGRHQAQLLADSLKAVSFDAIFTSPLKRAFETAHFIAEAQHNPLIRSMNALQELNLGIVDGMSSFTAYEKYKEIMDRALDPAINDFQFPNGEARKHGLSRFSRWLKALVNTYPEGKMCIVTHGGLIGLYIAHIEGLPLGQFRSRQPHHASVTRVVLTPSQARILSFDDSAHLTVKLQSAIEEVRNSLP